ncbi:MAG TPA: hypothetical protein PKC19_12810, partial [Roseiflexaceae bacterium]|nr:hypothetical protein [Roseiflexaceae bacterium]
DPFHTELGLHNLESIWQNYHRHGAARLILVDVVESRAMLDAYRRAIPGALVTLVRLHAALATIHGRLQQREQGSGLAWHRQRASELSAQMERDALEDLRIETTGKEALAVAHEILQRTQWMPA